MTEQDDKGNVFRWARDANGQHVHASLYKERPQPYTCVGCGREMTPVQHPNTPYFRHHVKFKNEEKCMCTSEDILHKVAKERLQVLKEMRIPSIIIDNRLIQPATTLKADSVLIERYICLTEKGITFIHSPHKEPDNFVIKPDVIFLDVKGKPILIIEICFGHKVDDEKQAKLMLLNIPAVEVNVRRAPAGEIDSYFLKCISTKWLYHGKIGTDWIRKTIEQTDSGSIGDEIPIPSETTGCRKIRLRESIRGIRIFIDSNHFGISKQNIEKLIRSQRQLVSDFTDKISKLEVEESKFETRLSSAEGRIREEIGGRLSNRIVERRRELEKQKIEIEAWEDEQRGIEREVKAEIQREIKEELERIELKSIGDKTEILRRMEQLESEKRLYYSKLIEQAEKIPSLCNDAEALKRAVGGNTGPGDQLSLFK